MTAEAAFAACRVIAKREAKNFYYAFRVLPRHKSDAMCAIYAFMRKADDLSDDETLSVPARRVAMETWLTAWRSARSGAPTNDPVFIAVNETQKRFGISSELLEELVRGTTMDLEEVTPGVQTVQVGERTLQVYATFDDLYRYCYLVASVVGLVCIRIFGYSDARAEKFAEHTGIAFQLTNILRDVKEDAERGRIYLPLDDLSQSGIALEDLLVSTQSGKESLGISNLLAKEIARAQEYYHASDELVPLLDKDARAAMEVLTDIYHALLNRIATDPAQVLRERVSVPTAEKLGYLARGTARSFVNRIAS